VFGDKFIQFGGADACIPGRLAIIPVMEHQASE
jgi:hypothetical protein